VPAEVIKTVCEPEVHKQRPQNSYDAQFCIPYAVASSLLRGRFGLQDLVAEAYTDPAALGIASKVKYEPDPNSPFPKYYSGEVIVTTTDGRTLRHREEINRGASDRPLTGAEIAAKFRENAALAVSAAQVERIEEAVLDLERSSASELSRTLAGVAR
jgi:2-methylcitrate dehydratase PrpD